MLLSRFWYVVLALLLAAAMFVLFLATSMYNRAGTRALGEGLSADSQVVSWYLKDDARQRSAQLIQFALDQDIQKYLHDSSESDAKVPDKSKEKVRDALKKVNSSISADFAFDAIFACDQHGRVVAFEGYEQASGMEDFELGGYPVVADALHGYVRDDTLVLDRVYRVVARPVEFDTGQPPAGAIIGARIIDDKFARELSSRTGAAIAFYANDSRVASAAPEGFDKSQLDQILRDLGDLGNDAEYNEKGRSSVRTIGRFLTAQYARLPGEAWDLGAGYAVARLPVHVEGPLGFFKQADDKDKKEASIWIALLIALLAAGAGIVFSLLEHSRPLMIFRNEAIRMAKGETDQLVPSKFRGIYRKIASDLNDGIEKVAAKGGVPRRAADLKQVLGDLPAEPQMSAFSLPGDQAPPASSPGARQKGLPSAPSNPNPFMSPQQKPLPSPPGAAVQAVAPYEGAGGAAEPSGGDGAGAPTGPGGKPLPQPPRRVGTPAPPAPAPAPEAAALQPSPVAAVAAAPATAAEPVDTAAEWHKVYEDFVHTKEQCGENTVGFSYEKFEQTLKKNQEALMKRHGAKRVKFSVYVKDGKAALKASPIRD